MHNSLNLRKAEQDLFYFKNATGFDNILIILLEVDICFQELKP